MTHNTSINIFGLNTIYGDVSALTGMIYMEIATGQSNHTQATHGATCYGDISGMLSLVTLDCHDKTHFTGTLQSPALKNLWLSGLSSFSFNVTTTNVLSLLVVYATADVHPAGSLNGCTDLAFLQVLRTNTLSGSLIGLTKLEYVYLDSGNSVTAVNITNLTKLCYYYISGQSLTSANTNQLLADVWANRNVAKTYTYREMTFTGTPTGQGITDKTNLQAYRTPNNEGDKALWTINTL